MNIGQKVCRIRKVLGITQNSIAQALGLSRQTMSKIEHSDAIDDVTLGKIPSFLGITSEAIRMFDADGAQGYFNAVYGRSKADLGDSISLIEKMEEVEEENKKLIQEIVRAKLEIKRLREI